MSRSEHVEPARRRGLAHEVADRLREEIFAGTYPPDAHLPEVELSAALEVSRGPVRDGLRMLEREGLVRVIWHRGAKVTTLTPPDILELHTLRGALEDLAVHQVASRATDDDLAAIDRAADAMLRSLNSHELVYSDILFHDAVFEASHHGRLIEAWQGIRRQVHLFLLTRIGERTEDYLDRMPGEHRELAKILRTGDAEAAVSMFATHRQQVFEVLIGPTESWRRVESVLPELRAVRVRGTWGVPVPGEESLEYDHVPDGEFDLAVERAALACPVQAITLGRRAEGVCRWSGGSWSSALRWLVLDPPHHDTLRGQTMHQFVPRILGVRPRIEAMVTDLLDQHLGSGPGEFDVVESLAYPLPVGVICALLGVPREQEPVFHSFAGRLTRALDPVETLSEEEIAGLQVTRAEWRD